MKEMSLVEVKPIYVTAQLPIFAFDLSTIADRLSLARQAIDELRITHPQSTPSNVKSVYMSPWKSHRLNEKFIPLCESVVAIAREVSKKTLGADLQALNMDLMVTDCWGIIYEQADYTAPHNHFPAEFGCAIYLEADENCAPIVFSKSMAYQPKPNTMVLFPGILEHEVPANAGRRVVVSMNLHKTALFDGLLGK